MEELLDPVQEEQTTPVQEETVEVVDIQFRPGQKVYFFDPDGAQFAVGDHVVMDTARGAEFGICTGANHAISVKDVVAPLRKILRRATAQDEKVNAENRSREKRAYDICMQKIENHGLDMQLVSAECAFDGSKILFYFTADERVDFRELVKDLAGVFHTRIELRQIGVRDKAKMVGGLGICGRPFCCASFLDDFQPVSIKMAKTQNLSLNPTKISGTCGRLMCCLKYEQDTYEDLIRSSPKVDSFVDTPEGRGTVIESEILRQRVKVQMEDNPETISYFANEDIAVLRSGKAKKSDPPIPADLAPISGSGKRPRRSTVEEHAPMLEPIRFRYSTESVAEEVPAAAPIEEAEKPSRNNRRRRGNRPEQPAEQLTEQPEIREAPKAEDENRRRQRRERKPRPEQPNQPKEQQPKQEPVQEQPAPEKKEGEQQQPRRDHRRRQRRDGKPENRAEGAEQQEKQPAPKQDGPKPEGAPKNRPPRPPRGDRPKGENNAPKENAPKAVNAPQNDGAPKTEGGENHKPRHRNNYRHHRRPGNGGQTPPAGGNG